MKKDQVGKANMNDIFDDRTMLIVICDDIVKYADVLVYIAVDAFS